METLSRAATLLEADLDRLGVVASARRRGEELIALAVGAHSVCLERLVALAPDPALLEGDQELAELLWVHRPSPPEDSLLAGLEPRLDRTLEAIAQAGVAGLGDIALQLLDTLNELYGSGLVRAIELLHQAGCHDTIAAALEDDLLAGALALHGLHPDNVAARAQRVLASLVATLSATGPQIRFEGVDTDDVVRLRVHGEPVRDRWRVALAAERAVRAALPDAAGVVVEGAESEPSPGPVEVFIPLSAIGRRPPRPSRWVVIPNLSTLVAGEVVQLRGEDPKLLACLVGSDLYVAIDPFDGEGAVAGERLQLCLSPAGPPSVQAPSGAVFVFDNPLPVQRDGQVVEVFLP